VRQDQERLQDILEAIELIRRHTAKGRNAFDQDEVVQAAVLRWIEIIGEAARALSSDLRDAHSEVPWRQIIAMRNILAHVYFAIDVDAVWSVVDHDLPSLEATLRGVLDSL
jgi:uncharacterized protein with HEPN domain